MPIVELEVDPLHNPRLAALMTSAWPAWLWSADASRILWTNAVGAAIFGAANTALSANLRFDPRDASASQIIRLAATLPAAPQERLERLRGFGTVFGRGLICSCTRFTLAGGEAAILVTATEPAGPALTLSERVRRLFAVDEHTVAVFTPEGTLLHATETALKRLAGATTLPALGAAAIAARALESGSASGASNLGPVDVARLGKDASRVLVLSFAAPPDEVAAAQHAAAAPAPTPTMSDAHVDAAPSPPPPLVEMPSVANAPQLPPQSPEVAPHGEQLAERRHPLRFVWKMDADGRFVVGSDEFIELVGPRTMAAFGRLWSEIATGLDLDPDNLVTRAISTRETWSGIVIHWPVDELSERLPVELSGLPVFDRDRSFRGYRGFGVCRDVDRINELTRVRRERPIGFMPVPEAQRDHGDDIAAAPHTESDIGKEAAATPGPPVAEADADATSPAENATRAERAALSVTPGSANVVPFRSSPPPEPKAPSLSPVERKAFRELAHELTSRLRGAPQVDAAAESAFDELPRQLPEASDEMITSAEERKASANISSPTQTDATPVDKTIEAADETSAAGPAIAAEPPAQSGNIASPHETPTGAVASADAERQPLPIVEQMLLERIPIGVLVYRREALLYANRHFLEWSGYQNIDALAAAGGLNNLFVEHGSGVLADNGGTQALSIKTQRGDQLPVEGRLFTIPWNGVSALALILTSGQNEERDRAAEHARGAVEGENRELKSILDAATDGIIVLDRNGRVINSNASADALFGKAVGEFEGRSLADILAPESERAARDYLERITRGTNMLHDSIEIEAHGPEGRLIPLAMTLARISGDRFCAVFRDGSVRKKIDEELRAAKREAQKAAAAKSDFLAKVSHEIRTPLNAMTGFAEVIMAERFGPIGNERYREYLKDIHAAGSHLVSLLNDLLDLSKIETGKIDLSFANVNLNDLTQQCVGIMQPQANRARIIIRTSLTHGLPQIVADERSLRQIVLNLLSNSIKFTGPGGQVIVSTAFADNGEAVLRVRDTGVGMSEKDVEAAMEPFRQTATSGSWGSGGTGLGLPLTKALAEANRANFSIKSAPNAGTLIEVAFPPTRVLAD
jgi:PAS domain S-box-containing protein